MGDSLMFAMLAIAYDEQVDAVKGLGLHGIIKLN
jgi:hypothetical protein